MSGVKSSGSVGAGLVVSGAFCKWGGSVFVMTTEQSLETSIPGGGWVTFEFVTAGEMLSAVYAEFLVVLGLVTLATVSVTAGKLRLMALKIDR